jgi:hypothetical protein
MLFQTKLLQKALSVASKNRKVSIFKRRQGERIFDTKIATLSEFALKFRSWQLDLSPGYLVTYGTRDNGHGGASGSDSLYKYVLIMYGTNIF